MAKNSIHLERIKVIAAACAVLFGCAATMGSASAESAQQFFGYSGGGTSLPASCDISKLLAENQDLLNQISQINDTEQAKLKQIQTEQSNLQPGDTAGGAALDAEQQQILDSTKSHLAAIKAQQDVIHAAPQGPSAQCKRAPIAPALDAVGVQLLSDHIQHCVSDSHSPSAHPQAKQRSHDPLANETRLVLSRFLR